MVGVTRKDVVLPAVPLLGRVGHGQHREGGHFIRRQPLRLAFAVKQQAAIAGNGALKHGLHKPGARHGAEQVDQAFRLLADQFAQTGALAGRVELHQIDVGIAIHAVQQAQHAHMHRLLPERQGAGHALQMMAKGAGLVPVLAHIARQHDRQHRAQVGIVVQPFFVQQRQGAFEQGAVKGMKR